MIKFQEREFTVSRPAKSVYGAISKITPKSKKMKLARITVKTDKKTKELAYRISTDPGSVAKNAAEVIGKNPLSVAPGYTGTTAALTALKKGKLTTPDSVLRNTVVGKPIYAATEYTGRKVGRIIEPAVNTVYNMAKSI